MGVLSAYGVGTQVLVQGMRSGHCPVWPATGIGYPISPPPLVSRFDPQYHPLGPNPPPGEAASAALLLQAVEQMVQHWGADRALLADPDCALIVGSGGFLYASNAELFWRDANPAAVAASGNQPFLVRGPSWGASLISSRYRMRGPVLTLSTGCSSSANALLLASEMIARGQVCRAIVVGAEGLSAVSLAGFDALMLLDPQGCRPFDRNRAGLQLGEAVAAVLLERDDLAPAAAWPARIVAGANLCDTHHLTSASPDGNVMAQVMRQALAAADIDAADVIAIKAHGTGSIDSDAAEANAIASVFAGAPPPIVALKRYLGHTLGACGALETAALLACVTDGFLPAAAGFSHPDPQLGISPLRTPQRAEAGCYLLNFFGFGGNYTSLVLDLRRPIS